MELCTSRSPKFIWALLLYSTLLQLYSLAETPHFWPKQFGGFLLTQLKDFLSYWRHTVKYVQHKEIQSNSSSTALTLPSWAPNRLQRPEILNPNSSLLNTETGWAYTQAQWSTVLAIKNSQTYIHVQNLVHIHILAVLPISGWGGKPPLPSRRNICLLTRQGLLNKPSVEEKSDLFTKKSEKYQDFVQYHMYFLSRKVVVQFWTLLF